MTVLVLVDHRDGAIAPATRSAIAACRALGDIHALVAGAGVASVAEAAARIDGVAKVLVADEARLDHALAEPLASLVVSLVRPGPRPDAVAYTHVVAAATSTGKNVLPRAAALLDVQPIGDVVAVHGDDEFVRPIYAGNALATVRSSDTVKVLTIRAAAFEPASETGGAGLIEPVAVTAGMSHADTMHAGTPHADASRFVSAELSESERPDLASARVVVSGGRGMGSGENFRLLEPIADMLGAAIGASRAAVDSGFVPNDHQVGQTGKIIAPDLYLAIGISGAIQHLAGMKDSKVIVAINKDADAPIFQVADYGLVADLFTALPELEAELRRG